MLDEFKLAPVRNPGTALELDRIRTVQVNRSAAEPVCSSARAPASVHKRSPVVSGRFNGAGTHSSAPPGWKDTVPVT